MASFTVYFLVITASDLIRSSSSITWFITPSPSSSSPFLQYVECLEDKLSELHKLTTCQPSRDRLILFKRRVKLLRGLVDAEKLKSASDKLTATEILSPRISSTQDKSRIKTQEIFIQTKSKYNREVRDELFGRKDTVRKRFDGGKGDKNDADLVLSFHHEMQEKVAGEMLTLAKNLKENLYLANEIIKKDVQVLDDSARVAESNRSSLRTNSDRLSEFVRRSCQYWLWISLGLVCFTFLWIVVFIRMFPKRVYHQV